jgi:hypothetical protein
MKSILSCAAILAMILLAGNADATAPVKKKTVAKKKTATSTAKKTASTKKGSATASASGKKTPAKKTTWRNRQTTPTPDRYREIQTALAAKGYLKPEEATGSWNTGSADALKKFQAQQNLESSGKINSLSLIALGLGPHRDATAAPAKPPQPGQ